MLRHRAFLVSTFNDIKNVLDANPQIILPGTGLHARALSSVTIIRYLLTTANEFNRRSQKGNGCGMDVE